MSGEQHEGRVIELHKQDQEAIRRLLSCTGVISAEGYTAGEFIESVYDEPSQRLCQQVSHRCQRLHFINFRYTSNDQPIAAWMVKPVARKLYPVVIFNRGGNNSFSALTPKRVLEMLSYYASWGFLVIASQYSGDGSDAGSDEFGGRDLEDIHNLYPLINDLADADEGKIGMVGHSRGGMMSYLCMRDLPWIRTVISLAGLSNLVRLARIRPEMQEVFTSCFGGSMQAKIDRSAIHFSHQFSKKCPVLLIHGTADTRVPGLDSRELSAALQRHQHPHVLAMMQGLGHDLLDQSRVLQLQRAWLLAHLKGQGRSVKKSQQRFKKTVRKTCVGSSLMYNVPDGLDSMVS